MKKHISKVTRLCLSVLLGIIFIFGATMYIPALALPGGISSDSSYSIVFEKLADPNTDNVIDYLLPSTLENGRLWTDKTVSADRAVIYDIAGKPVYSIDAKPNEFLITLSALSQSYTIDAIVEPTDTVFVLDISASMYMNKLDDGRSRVEVMVEALNEAIKTLMDSNTNNRIAVVAFGGESGNSRICPVLKLDHYNVKDGKYFSMKSAAYIQVSTQIPDSALIDKNNRSIRVNGGTPTQRGIYAGTKIFMDNADTTYSYMNNGNLITVTRKPNIVLLSDGGATLGWTDYKFENPGSDTDGGFDCGDANNVDIGIDILTVLTASYCKQLIHDHYYGAAETTKATGFFTIGLNINDGGYDALAVLDPATNAEKVSKVYLKNTYNMKDILDRFVTLPGGSGIVFPVLNKGSSSARSIVTVKNDYNYIKHYDYTDRFYIAENAADLTGAFQSVAQRIVSSGNYSTKIESGNVDFDGYLIFSDVIGEYMEFKGSGSLWFDNIMYNGRNFAYNMTQPANNDYRTEFITVMSEHQDYFNTDPITAASIAGTILDSCIAAGNNGDPEGLYYYSQTNFCNKIKYYADDERNWIDNYFDINGNVNPVPINAKCIVDLYTMEGTVQNPVSGENTNLMDVAFHVITALEDGNFQCAYSDGNELVRHIKKGQQVARWYIPASLIPMRTVTAKYDETGTTVLGVQCKETLPVRFIYAVGLRDGLALADMDHDYKISNKIPGENDIYRFYTNDWNNKNLSMAYFQPSDGNPYYYYTDSDADASGTVPLYIKVGSSYEKALSYSYGTEYYTLNEYFDVYATDYITEEYVKIDESVTSVMLNTGIPYIAVGAVKKTAFDSLVKTANLTETLPNAIERSIITVDGKRVELQLLGNNGRLDVPFTKITLLKEWSPFVAENPAYLQLYGNGVPVGAPVKLDAIHYISPFVSYSAEYIWNDLPIYELTPDNNGEAVFVDYTVKEGTIDTVTGIFTPFSDYNPPNGIYNNPLDLTDPLNNTIIDLLIIDRQPVWSDLTNSWSNAIFNNMEKNSDEMVLVINKKFTGLDPSQIGNPNDLLFSVYDKNDNLLSNPPYTYDDLFTEQNCIFIFHKTKINDAPFKIIETNNIANYYLNASFDIQGGTISELIPPDIGITVDFQAGAVINVEWTNEYIPANPTNLTINKTFAGILPNQYPADVAFVVTGTDLNGKMIYKNTVYYADFTGTSYKLEKLMPGYYTVTESGGDLYGYERTLIINENGGYLQDDTITLEINDGDNKIVEFTNQYTKYGNLIIQKIISGLNVSEKPSDIVFSVIGRDNANNMIYERYIDYVDFDSSGTYILDDAPPGYYTVTEAGGRIKGYEMEGPSQSILKYLGVGVDSTVAFTNIYKKIIEPDLPKLTLKKILEGLSTLNAPQNLTFTVIGTDSDENVIYSNTISWSEFADDSNGDKSYTLTDIPTGIYTITENGGNVDGYKFSANHVTGFSLLLEYEDDETIIFANTYDFIYAGLIIEKSFNGITPADYPDAVFNIKGTDGNGTEIYNDTVYYSDFVNGKYAVNNLVPGTYTVTESRAETEGYTLNVLPADEQTLILEGGNSTTFTFINNYTANVTEIPASLIIEKFFNGIAPADYPDAVFNIKGTDGNGTEIYNGTVYYSDFVNGKYAVNNLVPGTYTVTESGAGINGYILIAYPSNGHILNIENGDAKTITFVNSYTGINYAFASLAIEKTFIGLPFAKYPNVSFTVKGVNLAGAEIYNKIIYYSDFINGKYILNRLAPGIYTIIENGAYVNSYTLTAVPTDGHTIRLNNGENKTVTFTNAYKAVPIYVSGPIPVYDIPAIYKITVEKKLADGQSSVVNAGAEVNYIIRVTNTGEIPLTNIHVTDEIDGFIHEIAIIKNLNPNEFKEYTFPYKVPSDAKPGTVIRNIAAVYQQNCGRSIVYADITVSMFIDEHIWYIRGYEDNTIRPEMPVSRAEAAMVFFRLLHPKLKEIVPYSGFNDVFITDWYGQAIGTLSYYGIFGGYPNGSFMPDQPITKSELATVISRFGKPSETDANPYKDLNSNNWAYKDVLSATGTGWFIGDNDGNFRPDDDITRAEFVTAVNRVLARHVLLKDLPGNFHKFVDLNTSHWAYTAFMEAVYTHKFVRKSDGINEEWINIVEDGLSAPYNR